MISKSRKKLEKGREEADSARFFLKNEHDKSTQPFRITHREDV